MGDVRINLNITGYLKNLRKLSGIHIFANYIKKKIINITVNIDNGINNRLKTSM